MPINNHAVLLKGVNDSLAIQRELCRALLRIKVRPYYLFHCDPVTGAGHFRTPVWKGIEIIEGLRGHISGLGVPTYVVDAPRGGGKIPLMPNYLLSASNDSVVLRNYEGMIIHYHPTGEPPGLTPRSRPRASAACSKARPRSSSPKGPPRLVVGGSGRRQRQRQRQCERVQRERQNGFTNGNGHGNGNGNRRSRGTRLRIGIAFDLVPVASGPSPTAPTTGTRNIDKPETVEALAEVLARRGPRGRPRSGDGRELLAKVLDDPPDLVWNLAEGEGDRPLPRGARAGRAGDAGHPLYRLGPPHARRVARQGGRQATRPRSGVAVPEGLAISPIDGPRARPRRCSPGSSAAGVASPGSSSRRSRGRARAFAPVAWSIPRARPSTCSASLGPTTAADPDRGISSTGDEVTVGLVGEGARCHGHRHDAGRPPQGRAPLRLLDRDEARLERSPRVRGPGGPRRCARCAGLNPLGDRGP